MWKLNHTAVLLLAGFALSPLVAAEISTSDVLSKNQRQLLELERQQAKEDASKLRFDWVDTVNFSYAKSFNNDDDPTQERTTYSISVSQPVFKSGGIYYGIKYADATERYREASIDEQEKQLIKQAVELILSLRKVDLQIEKQKLLIANANIDVVRKKEQFLSGFLDSGFLDQAILDKNSQEIALMELESQKAQLMKSLNDISDADYQMLEVPEFDMVEKEHFIQENLSVRRSEFESNQQEYYYKGTVTTFLPSVSLDGQYVDTETENQMGSGSDLGRNSYLTYGFSVSMPLLDINIRNKIESARIDYLKSSLQSTDTLRAEQNLYDDVMKRLDIAKRKLKINEDSKTQYKSLLHDAKEQFAAGEKTQYDVDTLENSLKSKTVENRIYQLDRQIILLELYAKLG